MIAFAGTTIERNTTVEQDERQPQHERDDDRRVACRRCRRSPSRRRCRRRRAPRRRAPNAGGDVLGSRRRVIAATAASLCASARGAGERDRHERDGPVLARAAAAAARRTRVRRRATVVSSAWISVGHAGGVRRRHDHDLGRRLRARLGELRDDRCRSACFVWMPRRERARRPRSPVLMPRPSPSGWIWNQYGSDKSSMNPAATTSQTTGRRHDAARDPVPEPARAAVLERRGRGRTTSPALTSGRRATPVTAGSIVIDAATDDRARR